MYKYMAIYWFGENSFVAGFGGNRYNAFYACRNKINTKDRDDIKAYEIVSIIDNSAATGENE